MIFAIFGLVCIISASSLAFAQTVSQNPSAYQAGSNPFGLTYPQWAAKWHQLWMSMPLQSNPASDPTGKYCLTNQNDSHVIFLFGNGGGSSTRSCTVPAEKAIYIGILSNECSFKEFPKFNSTTDLLNCAVSGNQGASVTLTVDGMDFKNLDNYRVHTDLFEVVFPKNNFQGVEPGQSNAVADMWGVMLMPLSPGEHEVHFTGLVLGNPATGTSSFALDQTYHLLVKKSTFGVTTNKVTVNGNPVILTINSSSTVSNFTFSGQEKRISFNINGDENTQATTLVQVSPVLAGPYLVTVDGNSTNFDSLKDQSSGQTNIILINTGTHNISIIGTNVVPEFPYSSSFLVVSLIVASIIIMGKTGFSNKVKS